MSPAEFTAHEGKTRRLPKICRMRQFAVVAWAIFPAEVTTYKKRILTTAEKLDQAPRRQCGLGQLPGRLGRPAGKNSDELETLEASAAPWPWLWPAISARLYFFIQAAQRSVVAI